RLDGRPVGFRHPAEAIAAGVALVTEDRKNLGLFDQMTVGENVTIVSIGKLTWLGPLIDFGGESLAVGTMIARLRIKAAGGDAAVTSLSGGNQQKCVLARWLLTN